MRAQKSELSSLLKIFPASIDRAVRTTLEAMAELESKTCIRFVKRTTEEEFLWLYRGQGYDHIL